MKYAFLLLTGAACALALAACDNNTAPTAAEPAPAAEVVAAAPVDPTMPPTQGLTAREMAEMGIRLENEVIFGGDVSKIPELVTEDFVEHNVGDRAVGIAEYTEVMTRRSEMLAKQPGPRRTFSVDQEGQTVIYGPDSVTFIRPGPERDDPRNPGQKIRGTHFDLFRFENGKIAEHWD